LRNDFRDEEDSMNPKPPKTLRIARISILSALSVAGAFIHPPSPIQTVAFDSAPGFFATLLFGSFDGALVCGIGHICTSIINGFPLGFLHFPIALGMALAGWTMGFVNSLSRKIWALISAIIVGVGINTMLFLIAVPVVGWIVALTFTPSLLAAASLNAVAAALAYISIRARKMGI